MRERHDRRPARNGREPRAGGSPSAAPRVLVGIAGVAGVAIAVWFAGADDAGTWASAYSGLLVGLSLLNQR